MIKRPVRIIKQAKKSARAFFHPSRYALNPLINQVLADVASVSTYGDSSVTFVGLLARKERSMSLGKTLVKIGFTEAPTKLKKSSNNGTTPTTMNAQMTVTPIDP